MPVRMKLCQSKQADLLFSASLGFFQTHPVRGIWITFQIKKSFANMLEEALC